MFYKDKFIDVGKSNFELMFFINNFSWNINVKNTYMISYDVDSEKIAPFATSCGLN